MDKMRMESVDITDQNIEKIGALFPNVIAEAKDENGKLTKAINFELLKQELSKEIIDGDEAYEFTWVGKKAAIVEANKPIRKTLRPCKEESVNWDTTENLYIEGDNLEVLKLLQESYLGKVKMIYIDPPYNTGNDFIYDDNFAQSQEEFDEDSGAVDENGDRMFKNTDSNGRFHSDWCSMMYSRLSLARNLLSDDGVIFISIDDHEQENLKKICDEVFGVDNFIANIAWRRFNSQANIGAFSKVKDNIIFYCKKSSEVKIGKLPLSETAKKEYQYRDEHGIYARRPCIDSVRGHYVFDYKTPNGTILHDHWMMKEKDFLEAEAQGLIHWPANGGNPMRKMYLIDAMKNGQISNDFWGSEFGNNRNATEEIKNMFDGVRMFDFPKPSKLIRNLLNIGAVSNSDIVLDFFSGSATTAHAVMQLNAEDGGNRKFIMVQLPEKCDEKSEAYKAGYKNICEIGKERIRCAAKKIHEEHPEAKFDDGFRVLKVDESNMTDVYYSPNSYNQNMLTQLESNIKPDRTDLDLLFGCLTEWGLPLSMPYTSENIGDCTVHTYNDGDLIACFNENISESVIKEIAKRKPLRAVFRDSSFKGSPEKINVGETFKLLSPDTRVKII